MNTLPLRLNFAPALGAGAPAARWWVVGCAACLLVVLGLLGYTSMRLAGLQSELQQIHDLRTSTRVVGGQRPTTLTTALPHTPAERLQVQFALQTARRMQAPWGTLLAALEDTPSSVALLVVEPNVAQRSVVLSAETANAEDMLAYLRQLQQDPRLQDMHLVSHTVQAQSPGTPLRFQIEGLWGGTP